MILIKTGKSRIYLDNFFVIKGIKERGKNNNKRYFNLDDIESFIRNKQEKSNNIISDTIASWRSN